MFVYYSLCLSAYLSLTVGLYAVPEKIINIIDCNMKKGYQILSIFVANVSHTTGHQSSFKFLSLTVKSIIHKFHKRAMMYV